MAWTQKEWREWERMGIDGGGEHTTTWKTTPKEEQRVADKRSETEKRHDTIYAIWYETQVVMLRNALDNCPVSDITREVFNA